MNSFKLHPYRMNGLLFLAVLLALALVGQQRLSRSWLRCTM